MTDANAPSRSDVLQGTLEMLTLKALTLQPMHGWGISIRLRQISGDVFDVNQGSLYPALQRMLRRGWIRAYYADSENNRQARYYEITRDGLAQLEAQMAEWDRSSRAVNRVLRFATQGAVTWPGTTRSAPRSSPSRDARARSDRWRTRMRFHLEMETRWLMREKGLPEDEATWAAKRAFGGVEVHKDEVRDERGTSWLEDIAQDARFATAHAATPPRVHHRRVADARARHRRHHGALRRREGGAAHAAPI